MKAWILSLILSAGTIASAANLPPSFDAQKWGQLQTRIQADGKRLESEAGTFFSLSHIVPEDVTQTHHADYVSNVGYFQDGKFVPYMASIVSEQWTLTSQGDWDIDQWLYAATTTGELQKVYHIHLVEGQNRTIKEYNPLPAAAASSPEMIEQWGQAMKPWMTGAY